MGVRLNKVLTELNIGLQTAVEYLKKKPSLGEIKDDANVNTKISDEQYEALVKAYQRGGEPYYPVNNQRNNELYAKYVELANKSGHLYLGGRLGLYKYLDMDDTIIEAFKLLDKLGIKR